MSIDLRAQLGADQLAPLDDARVKKGKCNVVGPQHLEFRIPVWVPEADKTPKQILFPLLLPLEGKLSSIIVGLEMVADAERAEREQREARHRRWEEERIAREGERQHREIQARREGDLRKLVDDWWVARRIRAFASAVRRSARAGAPLGITSEQLAWMDSVAERTDPIPTLPAHRVWSDELYPDGRR